MKRLSLLTSSLRQLGPGPLSSLAVYQAGLRSGTWRQKTPAKTLQPLAYPLQFPLTVPSAGALSAVMEEAANELLDETDQILNGQFRMFSGPFVPLEMTLEAPLAHWSDYETGDAPWGVEDVKFIWEPARFGWAFTLARAYCLTGIDAYAQAFWLNFEIFSEANPPNLGPNWASGQEVALRLMAFCFAANTFKDDPSTSPQQMELLAGSVAAHAERIPPTLWYARAQNNNHLLSEAAGLITAGISLPDHPQANHWLNLGLSWFNRAVQDQFEPDGTYIQQSMNYHRLALHLSVWVKTLCQHKGLSLPATTLTHLAAGTRWLLAQLDPISGFAPNLGHNDGANILPLACGDYLDYRPTAQAASMAFLGQPALPSGPWDELSIWLGLAGNTSGNHPPEHPVEAGVNRLGDELSWATVRAAHFSRRPGQADQLHVDLWFRGQNIARDAGTYQYNLPAPWDNALAGSLVHNTLTIDGLDQMRRAGRFLWLDWAQARVLYRADSQITVEHDGYRRLGLLHRRSLQRLDVNTWVVEDQVLPVKPGLSRNTIALHWLLPDVPFLLEPPALNLLLQDSDLYLNISCTEGDSLETPADLEYQVIRAGELVSRYCLCKKPDHDSTVPPILGWYSPTYGVKEPSISLRVLVKACAPITLRSEFIFTKKV